MKDLSDEKLLVLTEAAGTLSRPPHVSTLHRWRTRGVRGVRLDALLVGGKWCTSEAALKRFFVETTRAATAIILDTPTRPKERNASSRPTVDVEKQLDRHGIR